MPVVIPTLTTKVPREAKVAIDRLKVYLDSLETEVQGLRDHLEGRPKELTLDQIREALAATGTHPLNVTGLVGLGTTISSSGTVTPTPPTPPPTPPPFPPAGTPQEGTGLVREGVSGVFHLAAGGATWPWRGCSDFRLFQRYLDGDATVGAVIANRVASGANLLRVFGMYSGGIGTFLPASYPTYFTALPAFATLLNGSGLFLEFTAFADAQVVMPTQAAQNTHWEKVIAALAGNGNVFLELANEYPNNGVNPAPFGRPHGILSSAGSSTGDMPPFYPPWDYGTFHPDRNSEWPRKAKSIQDVRDGYPGWPGIQRAMVADEPMGAGDSDIPGSRSTNAQDFFEFAATAQMMGAGATFHSTNGVASTVFSATQQACANAFFQAMGLVNPDAQTWTYANGNDPNSALVHSDLPSPTGSLRTYTKYQGGSAIVIVIRPAPGWTAVPQGGWIIDSQAGPANELVFLHR